MHAVWSRWAPPLERSKMATIAFSGSFIGTVISMPLSGLIANVWGWEAIFYVFGKRFSDLINSNVMFLMKIVLFCNLAGAVGLIWCILWVWIVKEAPRYDPYITKQELEYIENSIGSSATEGVRAYYKIILYGNIII